MKNYYKDEQYIIPFKSVVYVWYGFNYGTKVVEIEFTNKVIKFHNDNAERFLIEYKEWLENE